MADAAISNLPNQIEETAIGDMLAIDDVSAGETKKIPFESLLGGNALINQDFSVWQENTTFNSPAHGDYMADGFFVEHAAGGGTLPTVNVKKNTTDMEAGFAQCCELEITNVGATGATRYWRHSQKIEDFEKYRGKTVTASIRLKASTSITPAGCKFWVYDGTNTEIVDITTISTTWTTYSVTIDVADAATILWVFFNLVDGAGVISTTGSIFIQWMRLEPGSVFTGPPAPRLPGVDLALCQRYYQKSYAQGTFPGAATESGSQEYYLNGVANADHLMTKSVKLPVTMKAAPTITLYDVAGNSGKVSMIAGDNITGTADRITEDNFRFHGTNGAVNTARLLTAHYTAVSRV